MTASPIPPHLASASSSSSSAANQSTPRLSRSRPSASPQPSPAQSVPSPRQGSPRSSSPRNHTGGVLDVEAVLRSNSGDVERALEQIVAERNTLQQQNSQLWKLIEKQRAQCTHLVQDNERLRADRERANSRLVSAGLEPIGGKRLPHSSSSVGLGLRADASAGPGAMRRNNSDRDERIVAHTPSSSSLQVPTASISGDSSADSSPNVPPASLLPSPMADNKLRRESRMAFAPEVRSFLSLAESPRGEKHQVPPVPQRAGSALTTSQEPQSRTVESMESASSPGSTYSVSPAAPMREPGQREEVQPISTMAEIMEEPTEAEEVDLSSPVMGQEGQQRPPDRLSSLQRQAGPDGVSSQDDGAARHPVDTMQQKQLSTPTLHHSSPSLPSINSYETGRSLDSQEIPEESTPRQSADNRPSLDTPMSTSTRPSRPLPRLSPALLPHTRLSIPHTTVHPNSAGRDVLCFIVAITVRPPNAAPVSWTVAKLFSAFIDLDTRIKSKSGKRSKDWKSMIAPLPEGKAWKDFAPSKIDQRKMALEAYLQSVLVAPLSDKSDLCDFLSTDPVQAKVFSNRKEGYLTKKAKNFGGWRTRYFVLDGAVLECYENRGGPHHSSIAITNAQIGRQNRASEMAEDRESRHAFLIIEATKKGPQRHILCAESDMERDSWIEALVKYVDPDAVPAAIPVQIISPPQSQPGPSVSTPSPIPVPSPNLPTSTSQPQYPIPNQSGGVTGLNRRRSNSRKSSRDVVVTAAQPLSAMPGGNSKFSGAPSPSLFNSMENQKMAHTAATVTNGEGPRVASSSQTQSTYESTDTPSQPARPTKRQSMLPSRSSHSTHSLGPPPSHSAAYLSKLSSDGLNAPPGMNPLAQPGDKDRERKAKSGRFWPSFGKTPASSSSADKLSKPVFGVPLADSLAVATVASLPAIVFRCIEWLEAKRAEEEEGIYRLSGSSAVIKGLKDRFDMEGDVNLLVVDQQWDPHAIAGLLKSFLRELPTSLLTRELHPRFLAVMDLIDSSARVTELCRLVSDLPPPNYALLRALTAHLILIVKHAQSNKMTLRNIGIVFSPTLGIPAGIFSELVSHFGAIFDDEPEEAVVVVDAGIAAGEEEPGSLAEDTVGRKRNSMLYQQGGADTLLGLGGRALDPVDDSASDMSADPPSPDPESDVLSALSSENLSTTSHNNTPRADQYPSAAASRQRKKEAANGRQQHPVRGSSLNQEGSEGSSRIPS